MLALRCRGVSDLSVLRAMEQVPRELFAPRRYGDLARQDVALPLPFGQTMTAPGTVATMLAALDVRPGDRVLEIGSGSGYVTALLARMGAAVLGLERHPALADSAARRLEAAGLAETAAIVCADGLVDEGGQRFDRILLNGSVPVPPPGVTSRLAPEGRLVAGQAREGGSAALLTLWRESNGQLQSRLGPPLRLARLSPVPAA